ncbi:MAG: phosphatidate cytidylyltransferase [Euryarchaeota archaeon]|nr:phosphatidate cytidylyltransferase [Euryarchaeota archaeon]
MKKEILRQIIHASGIFIIFLEIFFDPVILILICLGIIICGVIIFRLDKSQHIFLFSTILRGLRRNSNEKGYIYFFIGVTIALVLFSFNLSIANASILLLALGDSASTVFGKKYGKTPLPFIKDKTLEGSLAFFIIGFAATTTQLPIWPSFLGALFGAIAEAYSPIDDNLLIPVISGIIMSLAINCI